MKTILIRTLFFVGGGSLLAPGALIHRYSFDNAAGGAPDGSIFTDSVGGADGVVRGAGASFTGTGLDLPGGGSDTQAYGDLPNNLISNHTAVTVEGWVTASLAAGPNTVIPEPGSVMLGLLGLSLLAGARRR